MCRQVVGFLVSTFFSVKLACCLFILCAWFGFRKPSCYTSFIDRAVGHVLK